MTAWFCSPSRAKRIKSAVFCLGLLTVAAFPGALFADTPTVSSGHSAQWYNRERSGEGLVLEVLSDELALVYWFTYDESGNQRWLQDVGNIDGDRIVFPELKVTAGGRFGPGFDPEQVERIVVGEAVLSFSDCNTAEWSYSAFGEAETIPMTRLTKTMAAGCQPINGVPGQPVMEYAGQSGSWYDPTHSGEGYTLQWMSRNEAAVIWFTYDGEGNQYWITGVGSRVGDEIVFPVTHSASGPSFGPGYDKEKLQLSEWGSLTLEINCNIGVARYESHHPDFGSGTLNLSRLTRLSKPGCPYQKPKLSDLYEFRVTEIDYRPLADDSGNVLRDMSFDASDIASDGTVVGTRIRLLTRDLFRWLPDSEQFSVVESQFVTRDVVISEDAKRAVATRLVTNPEDESDRYWEPIWNTSATDSWESIPNFQLESPVVRAISRNGGYLVGVIESDDEMKLPWTWSVESGQKTFGLSPGLRVGIPWAVSNDGSVFIGNQADFRKGFREELATLWTSDGKPEFLRDESGQILGFSQACNDTCDVIPGSYHGGELDLEDPNSQKFWLWTRRFGVQYFEDDLPGVIDSFYPPSRLVFDTSDDGSLFVGRYLTIFNGERVQRPVIWTQRTGVLSLFELLEGIEGWDTNWKDVQAVAVSSDGTKVLLNGSFQVPPERVSGQYSRAMILELVPKSNTD
ncbi:hypothetical protein F3N42_12035 [Marinihelvus fidelis]|uniref:Secreted protein n=1 Tax=Marinihelvus fidelis TaxID=2613842 RepID=A0A5N0T6E0_9GAMM|nr:hypothetical protein [Marinihelvus fidelis]KAA9130432.1 hypothetical protein F3N42_12035 [Marinihelvus fidelis]